MSAKTRSKDPARPVVQFKISHLVIFMFTGIFDALKRLINPDIFLKDYYGYTVSEKAKRNNLCLQFIQKS